MRLDGKARASCLCSAGHRLNGGPSAGTRAGRFRRQSRRGEACGRGTRCGGARPTASRGKHAGRRIQEPGRSTLLTLLLLLAFLGALLWQVTVIRVEAQESYPNRLVRVIVPFPAGGTADVLPRIVAEKLTDRWHQPVIIDNRAGAGGNIGAEAVAGSPPDGYVVLASPPGPIAINDNLYKRLAYQPSKFEPIIVLGTVPNVLVVKPAFPAKTTAELIDYVKANPRKVTFASQGNGSTSHLSTMQFQRLTGTEMV